MIMFVLENRHTSLNLTPLKMTQDAWEHLQKAVGEKFEYVYADGQRKNFITPFSPSDYSDEFGKIAKAFEKELESNFLLISTGNQFRYLITRYDFIETQIKHNIDHLKIILPKIPKKKIEIIKNLSRIQNDILFGLTLGIKSNKIYKDCLKSESWYWGLESEIEKKIKLNSKTKVIQTTFHWIGQPKQLELLWKYIQREKLIDKISFEDFKIIFSITPNRPRQEIKQRIRWIDFKNPNADEPKSNLRSLFAFLYFLKKEGKLLPDDFNLNRNTYNLYRRAGDSFANKDGLDFPNICKGNILRNISESSLKKYSSPKNIAIIKEKIPNF